LTGTGAAHMRATGGGVSLTGSPLTIDQSLDIETTVLLTNDLTNQGTITLGSHILDLGGHTLHNTGSLQTIAGPCTATLTHGFLDNTGTLTIGCTTSDLFGALGATNSGTITIAPTGVWTITNGYKQTHAGELHLDHDGGGTLGQLTTTGTVTLDGCIGGSGPALAPGTTLDAILFGSRAGVFSCTDFVGQQFTPTYVAGKVQLVAAATAPDTVIDTGPTAASGQFTGSAAASFTFHAVPATGATFECSLDLAPFSACSSPASYAGPLSDGAHTFQVRASASGATDATPAMWAWNVDTAPPSIGSCGPADGAWHATNVTFHCTATDTGAGLQNPGDATFDLTTTVTAGTENANAATTTHPTICDAVGNCTGTIGPITANMIDRKGPTIALTTPADGATYTQNQVVPAAYNCSDGGSGVTPANCTGTVANGAAVNTTAVGTNVAFTVTATDNVGNTTTTVVHYNVVQTPLQQLQALLVFVQNIGPGNSLAAKVTAAINALSAQPPNTAGACSSLAALVNETQAQTGKKLTISQATTITTAAQQTRTALHC
ncbi:MAG TPA: hypothetical protein VEP49_22680, partial [Acidimicrobiia bacterium]|nr:hypothetical protein [Acidimicrobiia bacterium]